MSRQFGVESEGQSVAAQAAVVGFRDHMHVRRPNDTARSSSRAGQDVGISAGGPGSLGRKYVMIRMSRQDAIPEAKTLKASRRRARMGMVDGGWWTVNGDNSEAEQVCLRQRLRSTRYLVSPR